MKNEKLEHLKQYLHQSFQGIDSFLKEIIYPIFGEDNVTSYNQNLIADNPELKTLASSSGIKEVKRFAQIELDFYPIDIFEVKLQSYDGYNNSVYLIDGICDTLYSTSDKGKAQNIKIEDIEEKINRQVFDFTQYEGNDSIVKYGETSEYNNSFKFPNICVLEEGYQRANNLSNQDITLGLSEQFLPITGISNATDNLKITSNYWYHCMSSNEFRDSMYYELLIRKEDNSNFRYWISSRCINAGSDAVRYNIRCIRNGEVTIANIFRSISINGGGYSYPVRPVVTLSYDIEIGEKVDNVWQIK